MDIIDSKQKEIIEEFDILDGDFEMMLNYLMELGDKMLPIKEKYKVEENIIKGCQSKVWLIYKLENNKFVFSRLIKFYFHISFIFFLRLKTNPSASIIES